MSEIKQWKAIGLYDDITATVGQTIRVKSVDENNQPIEWETASAQVDWNEVTNKPFTKIGDDDTLTWDGNTDGLISFANMLYKVSDATPTMTDFANGGTIKYLGESIEIPVDAIIDLTAQGVPVIIIEDTVVIALEDNVNTDDGLVLPEKGTYFVNFTNIDGGGYVESLTIPNYTGFAKEQIDTKVLPEALQFGSEFTVLLPESTYEIEPGSENGIPPIVNVKVGDTVLVKWNGTEYVCTATQFPSQELSAPCIGNLGAFMGGVDTGEPFVLIFLDAIMAEQFGAGILVSSLSESPSVTLSISRGTLKKLDNKYLDLAWIPSKKSATRIEVFPETTVDATGDTIPLTEEFKVSAEDKAQYIVTWNGTEYICNALLLGGQFAIGNLYMINPNLAPNTGEPFLFFTTGQNLIISYMDEGSATFKIDRGYYDTLPYEFAPANYIIPTDLKANSSQYNNQELLQAEYVLKHGGKVFCTVDGDPAELLSIETDTVDQMHQITWRVLRPGAAYGNIYQQTEYNNYKAQTPAVDRMDILLRYDNSAYVSAPPKKFKFTVDSNGNLMSADKDGTNQKAYLNATPVTAADNGKFLRVVDGAWAASIPDEYVTETELNNKGYLTQHQSLADYAKISEVDKKIADLVNSAPAKLNTLDELAAALGDDENFANTVTTELSKKVNADDLGVLASKDNLTASEIGAAEVEHTHDEYATKDSPTFTGAFTHGRRGKNSVGNNSFASGEFITASGNYSHAEGNYTAAFGENSHAEGSYTTASGNNSHAEGFRTIAFGESSHAEGYYAIAFGKYSHAEGNGENIKQSITGAANTLTYTINGSMPSSIRLGNIIEYNGIYALITAVDSDNNIITVDKTLSTEALDNVRATIVSCIAYGNNSHAEGYNTIASGNCSHAEGNRTTASGAYSHAEGYSTIASGNYSHVEGKYNIDDNNCAHIVGNGYSDDILSNAHTLDWSGNAWFSGDVYVGSTSGVNKDDGSKKLATIDEVNTAISAIPTPDVSGQITAHNTSDSAHSDIRENITTIESQIFNIDYDTLLAFDTSEIVFNNLDTTSILGKAILGKMILA